MYTRTRKKAQDAPAIHVSADDIDRLRALVEQYAHGRDAAAAEQLAAELERAVIVPAEAVRGDLVTMHSRVLFEDETGRRRELQLVYPRYADPSRGRISVLAPVGAALLGLSVGQTIDWALPNGRTAALTIVAVKPEPDPGPEVHEQPIPRAG